MLKKELQKQSNSALTLSSGVGSHSWSNQTYLEIVISQSWHVQDASLGNKAFKSIKIQKYPITIQSKYISGSRYDPASLEPQGLHQTLNGFFDCNC